MDININIYNLRTRYGFTQDEIANKIGVTRQTYIKFEKGDCDISASQIEKLADFFGVDVSDFYRPAANIDKFKEMIIYILNKFSGKGIPKTKLAKLLYLSDFSYYYNNFESISSVSYKCREYGPLADPFYEVVENMIDKGEIHIDPLNEGAQMLSLSISVNNKKISLLSEKEKQTMDAVCKKWKNASTSEVVNFTHNQKPWMACFEGERIPYDLILQEDPDNVF